MWIILVHIKLALIWTQFDADQFDLDHLIHIKLIRIKYVVWMWPKVEGEWIPLRGKYLIYPKYSTLYLLVLKFEQVQFGWVANSVDPYELPYSVAAGLAGSVGCAVRLETRRSRVQPPPRSATFFRGDWSWNIFYGHSLPSPDSRRAVVSFWRKNVHNTG